MKSFVWSVLVMLVVDIFCQLYGAATGEGLNRTRGQLAFAAGGNMLIAMWAVYVLAAA